MSEWYDNREKGTLLTIKLLLSYFLDLLILVYFLLIFFIILFGGFSVVIIGQEVSATSVYKPVVSLLVFFLVKLFVADLRKEIEKIKTVLSGTFLLIFFVCEVLSRIYYSAFVPQDLFWASQNMVMPRTSSKKNI